MIQQLIFTCCLVSAPQPITSLHPLSSCTSIPPSALQIRLFSAMKSLSAIPFLLNYFIISCSILFSGFELPVSKIRCRLRGSSKAFFSCGMTFSRPSFPREQAYKTAQATTVDETYHGRTFFAVHRNRGRIDSLIINNIAHRSRPDARARLGVTGESSFDNSRVIQTSGSGGAEARAARGSA